MHGHHSSRLSTRRGAQRRAAGKQWIVLLVLPLVVGLMLIFFFVSYEAQGGATLEQPHVLDIMVAKQSDKGAQKRAKRQRGRNKKAEPEKKDNPPQSVAVGKPTQQLPQQLPQQLAQQKQLSSTRKKKPVVIAYAISLVKCGDKQSTAAGLSDAAIVLRHSVHQTSVRNPASGSVYDYHMIAIVHKDAEKCAQPLIDAGFEVMIREQPVYRKDIKGEFLRKHIKREWCCGAAEFVKLYAYTLTDYPVVVHVDIDFAFYKPMDDLFDAMLLPDASSVAQQRIPLERPNDPWPKRVDAFLTKDWGQVIPGRTPLFQAGFLVTRPNVTVFDIMVTTIKEGDYVEGFGRDNGWGGKGYGALVGAMAAQGLIAYVYDILLPGTWMELNQCRFNHMGMDVKYRNHPNFRKNHPKVGRCRNDQDECEDCMTTDLSQIYNIHYTQCRKPWNCVGLGNSVEKEDKQAIDENNVNFDHCMTILTRWHDVRTDLEQKLKGITKSQVVSQGQAGEYKKEVFQGHCKGFGGGEYLPLSPEAIKSLPAIYKS